MAGSNGSNNTGNPAPRWPFQPLSRNRYFKGKLLTVNDMVDEQNYNNDKRDLANRFIAGPGILFGLQATAIGQNGISVSPGLALDGYGRELILSSARSVPQDVFTNAPGTGTPRTLYLCMTRNDVTAQPSTALTNPLGCQEGCDYGRWTEDVSFKLCDSLPAPAGPAVMPSSIVYENNQANQRFKLERFALQWVHPGGVFEVRYVATALDEDLTADITVAETLPDKDLIAVRGLANGSIKLSLNPASSWTQGTYLLRAPAAASGDRDLNITSTVTLGTATTPAKLDKWSVTVTDTAIVDKLAQKYMQDKSTVTAPSEKDPCAGSVCLARIRFNGNDTIKAVESLPQPQYAYDLPLLFGSLSYLENRGMPPPVAVADHGEPKVQALATLNVTDGLVAEEDATAGQANVRVAWNDGLQKDDQNRLVAKIGDGLTFEPLQAGEQLLPRRALKAPPPADQPRAIRVDAGTGLTFNNSQLQVVFANNNEKPQAAVKAVRADDDRLADKRDPKPHHHLHEHDPNRPAEEGDEINVEDLAGLLHDPQRVALQEGANAVTGARLVFNAPLTVAPRGGGAEIVDIGITTPPVRTLRYVAGNGQQGVLDVALPLTLIAGVEDEKGQPAADNVHFKAAVKDDVLTALDDKGNPLNDPKPGPEIDVTPSKNGLVRVSWMLKKSSGDHQVIATLVKAPGNTLALQFTATAWPRVASVSWPIDQEMTAADLQDKGLVVKFSENIHRHSATLDNFIVTIEIPDESGFGNRRLIPYGTVTAKGDTWTWNTNVLTAQQIDAWLAVVKERAPSEPQHLRCRVVLRASAILSANGQRALDGAARFKMAGDQGPAQLDTPPSGNGTPGSDFETWFYLIPGAG